MLHIDEHRRAAALLRLGDHVQGDGGLTAALRPEDLDDAPLGHAADAQRDVQRKAPGGDGLHIEGGVLPQPHDSALAKLLFDLGEGGVQRLLLLRSHRGVLLLSLLHCHIKTSI